MGAIISRVLWGAQAHIRHTVLAWLDTTQPIILRDLPARL